MVDSTGTDVSFLEPDDGIMSELPPPSDSSSLAEAYQSLEASEYRVQITGLRSGQMQQVMVSSDAGDHFQDGLTDYSGGSQSSRPFVLADNGGMALTIAQQAQILLDYGVESIDPPGYVLVQFTTGSGDEFQKKIPVDPTRGHKKRTGRICRVQPHNCN